MKISSFALIIYLTSGAINYFLWLILCQSVFVCLHLGTSQNEQTEKNGHKMSATSHLNGWKYELLKLILNPLISGHSDYNRKFFCSLYSFLKSALKCGLFLLRPLRKLHYCGRIKFHESSKSEKSDHHHIIICHQRNKSSL